MTNCFPFVGNKRNHLWIWTAVNSLASWNFGLGDIGDRKSSREWVKLADRPGWIHAHYLEMAGD